MNSNFQIINESGTDYLEIVTRIPLNAIQNSPVIPGITFRTEAPDRFLLPDGTTTTKQVEAMVAGIETLLVREGVFETNRLLDSFYLFGRSRTLLITAQEKASLTPDVQKRYDKIVVDQNGNEFYVYAQFSWREQKGKPHEKDGATIKLIRRLNENGVRVIPLYDEINREN